MIVATLMLVLLQSPAPSPAPASPAAAVQVRPEIAAEVERGTSAYNAGDIGYYDGALSADAVYIADDGATFVGKERILGLFKRIFGRTPKPQLAVTSVVTGGQGDVAWARFDWTLSGIEKARPGLAIAVFAKQGGAWKIVSIQNTAKGHGARAASPAPGASAKPHH